MTVRAGLRGEKAATTRASLISAARKLFSERGYHATGTPEVVALAGVTRGALYHHFRDKEALFEAVFHELGQELVEEASGGVIDFEGDRWRRLLDGLESFLHVVTRRHDIQRVIIVDGPSVLGWGRWRELESEYTLKYLIPSIEELVDDGLIQARPMALLAHLMLAALNEAALLIANSTTPEATREQAADALGALISGLR
jgi:AcrR family transcriptional regulator